MLRKFTRIGNDVALVFDAAILEHVRMDDGTHVEVDTDGEVITIRPVDATTRTTRIRTLPEIK